MTLWPVALIISFISITVSEKTSPYCDPKLCQGESNVHIACPGVAVNHCSDDAKLIDMKKHQKTIVDKINKYRNELASGKYPHLPEPARLTEVKWDKELAKIATIHVKQCQWGHDQCRNTKKFPYSGQNLFRSTGYDANKCIKASIDNWWGEQNDTTASHIESFPKTPPPKMIGHFTVMANEKSVRVGCGAIQDKNNVDCYVTCNFSWTNILNKPVYSKGKPGSKCKKGKSKKYPALCSLKEPIDYKKI